MPSGLNSETLTKTMVGAAVAKIAGVPIGVTRGIRCEFATVIRNVPFDGKVAEVAGLDRIVGFVTRVVGTFLQLGVSDLARMEHGIAGVLSAGVTTTTPIPAQQFFVAGNYVDDVQFDVEQADGDVIRVELGRALVVAGGPSGGSAQDEATMELAFEARQEP